MVGNQAWPGAWDTAHPAGTESENEYLIELRAAGLALDDVIELREQYRPDDVEAYSDPDTITVQPSITIVEDAAVVPAVAQQLVTAFDPTVAGTDLGVTPELAQSLIVAFTPDVVGGLAVTPAMAQQLIVVFAPTVAGTDPTVQPVVAQQLVTAFDPAVTTVEIPDDDASDYDRGTWFRFSDGRVRFAFGGDRSKYIGMTDWERVSVTFRFHTKTQAEIEAAVWPILEALAAADAAECIAAVTVALGDSVDPIK